MLFFNVFLPIVAVFEEETQVSLLSLCSCMYNMSTDTYYDFTMQFSEAIPEAPDRDDTEALKPGKNASCLRINVIY